MVLFGIKACDTCRKALKALAEAGHVVQFRDVRAEPLTAADITRLHEAFGERLINRASTTWRGLTEAERTGPPEALLATHPTLMKRPVIDRDGHLTLGWGNDVQAEYLA
jgi:arsenate reductase-like glutaredoxin family protein